MAIREEIKRNPNWKRSNYLSVFVDDKLLHTENPKHAIRKLLELICEFGKVADYKINTWKSVAFLSTNSEGSKREIQKPVPFTVTSKRINI